MTEYERARDCTVCLSKIYGIGFPDNEAVLRVYWRLYHIKELQWDKA